jgi:Xaa-Pro aminopeptidase
VSTAARRKLAFEAIPDGLPGLLVTTPANVRYLTGFTGSNGQLWLGEECLFLTDGRYTEQSANQVPDLERAIYTQGAKMSDLLAKVLAERGIDRMGVEAAHLTLSTKERLSEGLEEVELVPTSGVVEKVRRSKDEDEIASIRKAQDLAEEVLRDALTSFRCSPGRL